MVFEPKTIDLQLSPYTGLTRKSWLEACEYLLEGIFKNIKKESDPVVMPRTEDVVTYPHKESTGDLRRAEEKAEYFEGLARSMFIAAPLIHHNKEIIICGHNIRNYYKTQILAACTKDHPNSVGTYEELVDFIGKEDPFRPFQQTVETCALVVCLDTCKEEIWDTYTKEEKDKIAKFLSAFGHGNTVPQNWRLFNMLVLAFLNREGYEIDKDIMRNHGQAILNYYAGDGWYRDGHSFDYYSCWAFNVYSPIWNNWYGYENEPYLAKKFEENSNELVKTYTDFFDRDGFTNMWGRSNIYRNAATSPLDANFLLKDPKADPGLSRRIASGSLLQFLKREDFLTEFGIPAMGFYGQFTPLVQGYSCAESPLWLGKAFLCLHLSEDHPFWSEIENNGTWECMEKNQVKETVLNGPALCFTNHEANGETILRTGKVVKNIRDDHGMWNYSKLTYNTKYPWESAPSEEVESQQYVLKDIKTDHYEKGNVTFWHGLKKGVLYRRQFFNYDITREATWIQGINLGDFPVPKGVIRVDKLKLHRRPISITLGSYGFPDNGTEIIKMEKGKEKAVILKGSDFTGRKKQMAMTIFDGWDEIEIIKSKGTNPDSKDSIIIYGKTTKKKHNGYEPYILVSQVITKEGWEEFSEEEIFPIKNILLS